MINIESLFCWSALGFFERRLRLTREWHECVIIAKDCRRSGAEKRLLNICLLRRVEQST